jgi:hypothetical protein
VHANLVSCSPLSSKKSDQAPLKFPFINHPVKKQDHPQLNWGKFFKTAQSIQRPQRSNWAEYFEEKTIK